MDWKNTIFTDGGRYFVSNPLPEKGEEITLWLRICEWSPVKQIILRTKLNGVEVLKPMEWDYSREGLAYFKISVTLWEDVFHYHFYLVTQDEVYYYNQNGLTKALPDETCDFQILVGYQQPGWVKNAVFYQIFPDRFCKGNAAHGVKDGEYSFNGCPAIQVKNWNQIPSGYWDSHCMDFYGGDLEGIIQKIPYLKKLGINALYLNPIFYAATVHRYDCLDYFQVDPHLGGDEALIKLSQALHMNGMKLILDVSINHTGTAHKWFNKDGEFFPISQGAYHHPEAKERAYYFFLEDENKEEHTSTISEENEGDEGDTRKNEGDTGKNEDNTRKKRETENKAWEYKSWNDVETLPTLNYRSEALREIIYQGEDSVVRHWLKEPYSIDGWRFDVADVMARNDAFQLHHEIWPEIRKSIKDANKDAYILAEDWCDCAEFLKGNEWDSAMNYFGCARPIREFAGEQDWFLQKYEYFKDIPSSQDASLFAARLRSHLHKLPTVIQQNQFNLLDSHDIARLHNNPAVSHGAWKNAVLLQFALPGCVSVYYGDEAGIDGRIQDVEGCRYPMPWDKDFQRQEAYVLHHRLIQLRKKSLAFTEGSFEILYAREKQFVCARFTDSERYLVACSMDKEDRTIDFSVEGLGWASCAKGSDLSGEKWIVPVRDGWIRLSLPAESGVVLRLELE